MDKSLVRSGLVNSALLAVCYVGIVAQQFAAGSTLFGVIGIAALGFTINDAVKFYKAL